MSNKVEVTCFTDLKESTLLTEKLGNTDFNRHRLEYLRVGTLLAESAAGKSIKNTGDGLMMHFENLEPALHFAMHLQQFYLPHACLDQGPISTRVGLFLGVIEPLGQDVFGSGVNQAARVEATTPPGEIWLNKELVDAFEIGWGSVKISRYFKQEGEFDFKGIPGKQLLYSFDWRSYSKDHAQESLALPVLEHLRTASVVLSNFSIDDACKPSSIIWPVVPRNVVNAIHRGQIEIIRLLTLLGWKVHVLIADCGSKDSMPRPESENFSTLVHSYMTKRGLKDIQFTHMSDLFKPKSEGCHIIHGYFQKVISELTLKNLLAINQKDYDTTVKETIQDSPTLNFLHPALTIAAVLRLSESLCDKSVVVVGHDERIQWESAHDIPGCRYTFGVLFNPVLKTSEGFQARQSKNWPYWDSWEAMAAHMSGTNLAAWTCQLHAFLPGFPSKDLQIGSSTILPDDWHDKEKLDAKIDKNGLARHVFQTILSI